MEIADNWVLCVEVDGVVDAYTTALRYTLTDNDVATFLTTQYIAPVDLGDLLQRLARFCSEYSTGSAGGVKHLHVPGVLTLTIDYMRRFEAMLEIIDHDEHVARRFDVERTGNEIHFNDDGVSPQAARLSRWGVRGHLQYSAGQQADVDQVKCINFLGLFRNDLYIRACKLAKRLRREMMLRDAPDLEIGSSTVGLEDGSHGRPALELGTLVPREGYSSLYNCRLEKRLVGYEAWPPLELLRLLETFYVSLRRSTMFPRRHWPQTSNGAAPRRSADGLVHHRAETMQRRGSRAARPAPGLRPRRDRELVPRLGARSRFGEPAISGHEA
jgi:hypothetical protein